MLTFLGFVLLLFAEVSSPALSKSPTEGTEVATVDK